MRAEDQVALDLSLRDAKKCARRLSRMPDSNAHSAALAFVRLLIEMGAKEWDE